MASEKHLPFPNDSAPAPRRRLSPLKATGILALALFLTAGLFTQCMPRSLPPRVAPTVDTVLRDTPLIDGHNDFAIFIRAYFHNRLSDANFTDGTLAGQVDFPRLRAGRLGGAFWSVFVPCPAAPAGNHSDAVYYPAVHDTLQQIDLVHRLIAAFPEHLAYTPSAAAVRAAYAANPHRIAGLLGVEGLHQIGNSASTLRLYHALGVRYATLTHNCHNAYADSVAPAEPLHNGLSDAGVAMVREMNRAGVAVDLSHTSPATQAHALRVSRAPVLYSHSSAWAIFHHGRNVHDAELHALKANDGVVMVTFFPEFLATRHEDATLADVVEHVVHIGELVGYRHVGIGSDFDGIPFGPKGLEDVGKYPALIKALLERGVGVEEMKGVVGGNVLRVLEAVERVAAEMQSEGVRPLEDVVAPVFGAALGGGGI
ncbi:dipeptidase [Geopyxis carbonaria]|nr:dipeptidase [Geopyxis carbonaria]